MGCDIHSYAERETPDGYELIDGLAPFDWRDYGMYGFLAGVRNHSAVTPIAAPRGLPFDLSLGMCAENDYWNTDGHDHSWLSVAELAAFDYDQPMEDCYVTQRGIGGRTCAPGDGKKTTFREFLGKAYFSAISKLQEAGAARVVFWFDN